MNEVMSILRDVTGDGGGGLLCNLNLEAVKVDVCFKAVPIHFNVLMIGPHFFQIAVPVLESWRAPKFLSS